MTTPLLSVQSIGKSFISPRGEITPVIHDISLELGEGEFVSVIGPSGSGKSTLFTVLAEQLEPTRGSVTFHGARRAGEPFSAYMPQKDLLFPWLTVEDNAALGLVMHGMSKRESRRAINDLLPMFRLNGRAKAYPFELSGGMRQRVALLRTVVQDRPVLLLDEPFGALDYLTRTELQLWLADLCVRRNLSVVLITHDVPEALFLSDRVYVLSNRPATIRMVLEQKAPRPRGLDVLESAEFKRDERALLDELTASAGANPDTL
jgi:ABC-type nitrate/sulfonate/bicarbonate transport system ATPase subunit